MTNPARIASFILCGSFLGADVLNAQFAEPWLQMGTDARGYHLFQINPAALSTQKSKGGVVLGRHSKSNSMQTSGNNAQTLSNSTTETLGGFSLMGDIGSGASAGLAYSKIDKASSSQSSNATQIAEESMVTQTFTGRMVISLNQELSFGMNMRYLHEAADVLGSFNANRNQRVVYKGRLAGYSAGVKYAAKEYFIGGSYYPPLRGKAEIISEDKLITEPGITHIEGAFEREKVVIGLSIMRWIYRRDERAPLTQSEDGQRTLSIFGLDFDRSLFPIQTIMLGGDYRFDKKLGIRLSASRHTETFEFDTGANPVDNSKVNQLDYNKYKGALIALAGKVDVQFGFGIYNRSKSIESSGGQSGGEYTASGRELFVHVHSEF